MKCGEIIEILNRLAPESMACDWDNPGLLAGRRQKEVKRVLVAVDADDAVVEEARRRGLRHEERHATVEYLVAHGIASSVDGEQVRIGSAHFIFEDEKVTIPEGEQAKFDAMPPEYSQLYLAIRRSAFGRDLYLRSLREERRTCSPPAGPGVKNAVMLTGDSPRTAAAIAKELGVDDFRAGVLPADKAEYVATCGGRGTPSSWWGTVSTTPRPLRGGRGYRHQRRGGHRPGDRRHHHRRRQPVGVGAPAAAGHGPYAPHPEQLPLRHRL